MIPKSLEWCMEGLALGLRDEYYAEYRVMGSHCISVKSKMDNTNVVAPAAWSPGDVSFKDRVRQKMDILIERLGERGCLIEGV